MTEEPGTKTDAPQSNEAINVTIRLLEKLRDLNDGFGYQYPTEGPWIEMDNGRKILKNVGLKIHVPVYWQDPDYLEAVEKIVRVCARKQMGLTTNHKFLNPSFQETLDESNSQFFKGATIWPNYLRGYSETNVGETHRLVDDLKKELRIYPQLDGRNIGNELRVGNGIFIRPGPLTGEGPISPGSFDYEASFDDQLERLSKGGVDPLKFREEMQRIGWL